MKEQIRKKWKPSKCATEESEAGTVASDFEAYLKSMDRRKKWVDSLIVGIIPHVLETEGWQKRILSQQDPWIKSKSDNIILVALRDKHYRTVVIPEGGCPKEVRRHVPGSKRGSFLLRLAEMNRC